jgi:hypothetical protein
LVQKRWKAIQKRKSLLTEGVIMAYPHHDFAIIAALDLDPIKVKLMHRESGEGWSLEQANAVEFEYRRFLYLMKKFPNEKAAPRSDVDIFWHYHILDTIKYASDCEAVFGYFLHHFPYIGLRGEDDLVAHQRVGERMRELYETTFNEPFLQGAVAKKATLSADIRRSATSVTLGTQTLAAGASTTAWSLSPGAAPALGAGSATAWSLSPGRQATTDTASATAWSLSPGKQATTDTASATAWSLSPGKQATTDTASATAWSLSPGKQVISESASATAWSLSPGADATEPRNPGSVAQTVWDQHSPGFLNVRPSLATTARS